VPQHQLGAYDEHDHDNYADYEQAKKAINDG